MIHIEAAVLLGYHIPLRIYVDSCVTTVTPNPDSQPRYPFIENHGWDKLSRLRCKLKSNVNTETLLLVWKSQLVIIMAYWSYSHIQERLLSCEEPQWLFMNMYVLFCHIRCLSDSKRTGAKSLFLQRSQEDKLQFQLKAFKFHQDQPGNNSVRSNLCVTGLKKKPFICVFPQERRWVSNFSSAKSEMIRFDTRANVGNGCEHWCHFNFKQLWVEIDERTCSWRVRVYTTALPGLLTV